MNSKNEITMLNLGLDMDNENVANIEYDKNTDSYGYDIDITLNKNPDELWKKYFGESLLKDSTLLAASESVFFTNYGKEKTRIKFFIKGFTICHTTIEKVEKIHIHQIKKAMKKANLEVIKRLEKENLYPVGEEGQIDYIEKIAATINLSLDNNAEVLANA